MNDTSIIFGDAEASVFFVIFVVWAATELGIPRRLAPFAAAFAGIVLTVAFNWADLTSVERVAHYATVGVLWGTMAVGLHKTVKTAAELRDGHAQG